MDQGPFKDDGRQHYYLRDKDNVPYGTVVIYPGTEPGLIHRGIALCADMDKWDRVIGRKRASNRVTKAIAHQHDNDVVFNNESRVVQCFVDTDYDKFAVGGLVFKSRYNAVPTEKEKVILENLLKRQAATVEAWISAASGVPA